MVRAVPMYWRPLEVQAWASPVSLEEDEEVYLNSFRSEVCTLLDDQRETYSVGVAALRPTRARAAVILGRCMMFEVFESLLNVLRRSVDGDLFNIRRAEGPFVPIRDNLKHHTYLCIYLLSNLDYPLSSRSEAAYHKRHRPLDKVVCKFPSRVCKKQWPGLARLTTSLQTCTVWGYTFPPGVNYLPLTS
jgi:hypothetical protein